MQQGGRVPQLFTATLLAASVFVVKKMPPTRKCEVTYTYNPVNQDELQLNVGEIIEIIREVEAQGPPVLWLDWRTGCLFERVLGFLHRSKTDGGWA